MSVFNKHATESTSFGSEMTTIITGSRVVQEDDLWTVPADDTNTPVPISCKLKYITNAFDRRLWNITPDEGTYDSLDIATKLTHLETALKQYPSSIGAQKSSGKYNTFM